MTTGWQDGKGRVQKQEAEMPLGSLGYPLVVIQERPPALPIPLIRRSEMDMKVFDAIAKAQGYVKLADDQSLPKGLTARLNLPEKSNYLFNKEALDRACFRKVIL